MNSKDLGLFIAEQRKALGLTQLELAEKLYVTDKAVSRWERGVGLPDINLLEPLAVALQLTVSELILCKKETIEPTEAVKEMINYVEQKKAEHRKNAFICLAACFLIFFILLLDQMGVLGFIFVVVPFSSLVIGIVLLIYAIIKKIKNQSKHSTIKLALLFLLIPIIYILFFLMVGIFGIGPIPS